MSTSPDAIDRTVPTPFDSGSWAGAAEDRTTPMPREELPPAPRAARGTAPGVRTAPPPIPPRGPAVVASPGRRARTEPALAPASPAPCQVTRAPAPLERYLGAIVVVNLVLVALVLGTVVAAWVSGALPGLR